MSSIASSSARAAVALTPTRLGADKTVPYGIALLRLALGALLLAHGGLKFLVFTLAGTAGFFASVGFPAWMAYVVAPAEVLAGLALIVGFQTRRVALLTLPILLGALSVHLGNGWVFSSPNGGWEFPAFLAVASLAQALLGSGALSLDALRGAFR